MKTEYLTKKRIKLTNSVTARQTAKINLIYYIQKPRFQVNFNYRSSPNRSFSFQMSRLSKNLKSTKSTLAKFPSYSLIHITHDPLTPKWLFRCSRSSKMTKNSLGDRYILEIVYQVDFNCVEEYDGFRLIK